MYYLRSAVTFIILLSRKPFPSFFGINSQTPSLQWLSFCHRKDTPSCAGRPRFPAARSEGYCADAFCEESVGNVSSSALHMARNSAYITGIRRLDWYEVNGICNCWVTYLPFHQVGIGKRSWQIIFLFGHSHSSCCVSPRCPLMAYFVLFCTAP